MFRLHRRVPSLLLTATAALLLLVEPASLHAQTGASTPAPRLVVFEAFMRST